MTREQRFGIVVISLLQDLSVRLRGVLYMSNEEYKEEIKRKIDNISNNWILDRILKFIIGITK